ncbi:aminotransferase class V-fold PLP-dependent enzyme [Fusibacter ferrireducens]|uniref:Aminotransferase class V-fold PLP-dependent enzyme n=1 Tax=Fusibacter ferrireducens TaxID=2785058 RepID=A0ABR9ZXW5_9FIRM|nr:aminotransferase class V-fold PLP-dependent enzyme [Fusibacter ferrireducens]MBF4695211.1 aminotransferase class V-fold PLP-dependent enzyme [Fusibacter ferrireducens]
MKTYPIQPMSIHQAMEMQFHLVNCIHETIPGGEMLTQGDLGVVLGEGAPTMTRKVEAVLAKCFGAEAAILVRGSGTGAMRNVFNVLNSPLDKIVLHDAPIYPTTKVIIESMGLKPIWIDYNLDTTDQWDSCKAASFALIQHSRQRIDDSYELQEVIQKLRQVNPDISILVDDNYAVMKAAKIGVQVGADVSAFSMFKLLGPEGVGCVVGKKSIIESIRKINYSGGSQVQGHEALEALRALVYTPVSLAIQSEQVEKAYQRLLNGEVKGVKNAYIANAQSRVLLVEFEKPIAKAVLEASEKLGAAPHPVGAESKYEVVAQFYRVSATFRNADPALENSMIRINPMRSGADTVINVLKRAIEQAEK